MNTKYFPIFFIVLMSLALVSAQNFSIDKSQINFYQHINSSTFTVTPTSSSNPVNVTISPLTITDPKSGSTATFSIQGDTTNINSSRTFTITPTIEYSKLKWGKTYSGTLTVANTQNSSEKVTSTVNIIKTYCSSGESTIKGKLVLDTVDITNDGDGDDDSWMPMDDIKIKIVVNNENTDDSDDIKTTVKIGLFNSDGSEKLSQDTISFGTINGDDDATKTIEFKVPADIEAGSYRLLVKAYKNSGEKDICTSEISSGEYYLPITIEKQDDDKKQVVFTDVVLNPEKATCGEEVTLTASIVNIGTDDQDKVMSILNIPDLGIKINDVITSDLNEGDKTDVQFTFKIPNSAVAKTYNLQLLNKYTFDNDYQPIDEKGYEDSSDAQIYTLTVEGCNPVLVSNVDVTASLETPVSSIKAGNDVAITINLKNTGSSTTTYTLSPEGFDSFAAYKSLNPPALTLASQASGTSTFTLTLNSDATGTQEFDVVVSSANGNSVTKTISFSIPAKSSLDLSGLFGNMGSNWFIWVIILINVILIIAIIIVAIKVSRS